MFLLTVVLQWLLDFFHRKGFCTWNRPNSCRLGIDPHRLSWVGEVQSKIRCSDFGQHHAYGSLVFFSPDCCALFKGWRTFFFFHFQLFCLVHKVEWPPSHVLCVRETVLKVYLGYLIFDYFVSLDTCCVLIVHAALSLLQHSWHFCWRKWVEFRFWRGWGKRNLEATQHIRRICNTCLCSFHPSFEAAIFLMD